MSKCQNTGQIQLIFGPMFSGKTTELIRRIKRFETANHKCLVMKYAKDTRYEEGDCISTHDRNSYAAVKSTSLNETKHLAEKFSVIGIDEGQFFKDIVEFSEEMANLGKIVIVAALDGTFQRKGFADILNLVPLSESIVKLNAICMVCFNDASFSKRISEETQVELIGGKETYLAVCRTCYFLSGSSKPSSPQKKQFGDLTNMEKISTLGCLNATKINKKICTESLSIGATN